MTFCVTLIVIMENQGLDLLLIPHLNDSMTNPISHCNICLITVQLESHLFTLNARH